MSHRSFFFAETHLERRFSRRIKSLARDADRDKASVMRSSSARKPLPNPPCRKFSSHLIEKPWGRREIPPIFGVSDNRRIGEISFRLADAGDLPLLAKYIFTSEKLSIQVHPSDDDAVKRGLPRGKSECWYILEAEPGAALGIGLKSKVSKNELRFAAHDGSIEQLIDWKPVQRGDLFYIPAGTVHAIGAGIALLELQQNSDTTYRLYDYGRARELHVDDGVAVANPAAYDMRNARSAAGPVDAILQDGPLFSLVRASAADPIPLSLSSRRRWVMPIEGTVSSCGELARPGECMLLEPGTELSIEQSAVVLIGVEGSI